MTRRRFRKWTIYGAYTILIISIITISYTVQKLMVTEEFTEPVIDYQHPDIITPVVDVKETIGLPYNDSNVKLSQGFYDYLVKTPQEDNLIFHQDTYLPSTGLGYTSDNKFSVLSIYPGVVVKVMEDNLLGKIVEIDHGQGLVSSYQALSEVNIKKDDYINKGTIIGTSGFSNINKDLGNHLYFELICDGKNVNPDHYYGKNIEEAKQISFDD